MNDQPCPWCSGELICHRDGSAYCPDCAYGEPATGYAGWFSEDPTAEEAIQNLEGYDPYPSHAEPPTIPVSVVMRDYWGEPLDEVEMIGFLSAQGPVSPLDFPPPWTEVFR